MFPEHQSVTLTRDNLQRCETSCDTHRGGGTVLLVEDETAVRDLVSRFLTLKGYDVLSAADSDAARDLWSEHKGKIDLLLADIVMARGLSGRELALQFRAENSKLNILLTSGYNLEGTTSGSAGERIGFIPKPYRPEQLLAAVRGALAGDDTGDFNSYGEDSSS
jgi:two-component system cell cycle sensor histidine kinase/response regulator CckA